VKLTEQEFQLLYVLATHAGVVFNREGLLCEIWGRDRFVTVRSVDTPSAGCAAASSPATDEAAISPHRARRRI
jgi:hypothetical protein